MDTKRSIPRNRLINNVRKVNSKPNVKSAIIQDDYYKNLDNVHKHDNAEKIIIKCDSIPICLSALMSNMYILPSMIDNSDYITINLLNIPPRKTDVYWS